MYLKRKIDEYLLEWKKNEERLPLIIKGARQIGKTESINHFAEQNYSNIVSINFVLEPKHRLTRAHREKQLKMSCQALHNAPPNRT